MSTLNAAIESLYQAFADVEKPTVIDGCIHCIDDKGIDTLLGTPRRELTADNLSSYASSAFLTVGEVRDYMYFLPRILELSSADEMWWPCPEVTGRAIKDADWREWSQSKQVALITFLMAKVQDLVETGNYWPIDDWLCAIGRIELDVIPFLAVVETDEKAVLEVWRSNAGKLDRDLLGNEFWELPNEQHDAIVRWLKSPKINLIYAKEYGYRMN